MTAMHLLCEREYLHSNIGFMTGKLRCSAWKHLSAKLQQLHLWHREEKRKTHTSQVIMRTFLNVRPGRAFRTPEKCPSTCEDLIAWLINISSIVMNKHRLRTGQVEITFAGLLRVHPWNLPHPSCQPPIENTFSLSWLPIGFRNHQLPLRVKKHEVRQRLSCAESEKLLWKTTNNREEEKAAVSCRQRLLLTRLSSMLLQQQFYQT